MLLLSLCCCCRYFTARGAEIYVCAFAPSQWIATNFAWLPLTTVAPTPALAPPDAPDPPCGLLGGIYLFIYRALPWQCNKDTNVGCCRGGQVSPVCPYQRPPPPSPFFLRLCVWLKFLTPWARRSWKRCLIRIYVVLRIFVAYKS